MLDPVIKNYFTERKAAWLKKNLKASMTAEEEAEKTAECDVVFSLENWLPEASKRAGQMNLSTHPCTLSHPSARKNKNGYATPIIAESEYRCDGFLRTGNVAVESDALGNAAALDVYKFLTLVLTDGQKLLTHIERNTAMAQSLLTIKSQSCDLLRQGFLAMIQRQDEQITSSKIKQVYFPVDHNTYHQLSLLTASGIVFDLRSRINSVRFGDETKNLREKRKKGEYDEQGYRDIVGLTVIGYGGTKPQNISVLNNQNGGKAYLLSSLPPTFAKRDIQFPRKDFFMLGALRKNCREIFYGLHRLYQKAPNNYHTRNERDEYYRSVINHIITHMWQIRGVSSQFNEARSLLSAEQKVWLLDDYKTQRVEQDDWLDEIVKALAKYIFRGYEKALPKAGVMLGDGELQHIQQLVNEYREALR